MNANSGRKHQVKVRSVVGVHESLLAILEDSNTIALCGNSTSGDNLPPPPSILERDEKSIVQGSKRYTFDACFPVKRNETDLDKGKYMSSLKVNIDSCVSLLLAGFNSTLLLSDMFAIHSSDSEAFSDIGVAKKILETMYTYNSFSIPPTFEAGDVDATMKLQICCYEVFDSAIFDLIPSSFSNAKGSAVKKPRVNQHVNAVDGSMIVDVDGVSTVDVSIRPGDSPETVVSLIRSAISERLVLVKSNLTPNSVTNSSMYGSSIIGAVGNLFLTLKVEQVWQKSNSSGSDGRDTCYRRQASLTLVSLASASTYKSMQAPSSKPKDILSSFDDSVPMFSLAKYLDADSAAGKVSASKVEEDGGAQEKLQKQLNGALKALSSLSRIVQIRRNMESNESVDTNNNNNTNTSSVSSGGSSRKPGGRKNTPIATAGGPSSTSVSVKPANQVASQHIPYRDSVLTRLLQSSLEGNCFLFVLLYIKPKSTGSSSMSTSTDSLIDENTYRMVQFASEISSIHNTIWANDAIIPQYVSNAKTIDDNSKFDLINDTRPIHPIDSCGRLPSSEDLLSKPVEKGQGYELIQNALKLLSDDLRMWDIEQLDCIKNLGKEIVPTKVVKIYRNNERYSNFAVSKEECGVDSGGKDYDCTDASGCDSMGHDIHDETPSSSQAGIGVRYVMKQADTDARGPSWSAAKLDSQDGVVSSSVDTVGSAKGTSGGTRVAGRSSSSAKTSGAGAGAVASSPMASSRKGDFSRSGIGTSSSKESPSSNSKLGSMKRVTTADSSLSTGVHSAQFISKSSDSLMDSNGHTDSSNLEEIDSSSFVDFSESPSPAPITTTTTAVAMKILRGVTPSTRRVQVLPPLVKTPKSSPSSSSSSSSAKPSRSKQSKNQSSSNNNNGIRLEVSPGSNDANNSSISKAKSPQGGAGGGVALLPTIDASLLLSPRRGGSKLTPRAATPSSSSKGRRASLSSLSDRAVVGDALQHEEEPEDDVEQTAKEGRSTRPRDHECVVVEESEDHLTEEERHFLHCVARGFLDLVEDCIIAGVDITVKNRFNRDALQIATRNGYFPILKRLYKAHGGRQGGGLQQVMSTRSIENGDSLVHIAARYGHLEILRWFKDIGFPFNVVNHKGRSPVHAAAERAQLTVIQYLYNVHGHHLNFAAEDEDGLNPLDCVPLRADMVEASTIQHCREFISDIYVYG